MNIQYLQASPYINSTYKAQRHSAAYTPAASAKFGSCFCPICASMTILVEANNRVKKLQAGDTIDPEATLKAISSKTGFNYVPHSRATRLALPAKNDIQNLEKTALDLEFTQNGLKLSLPPENSLYSAVYEGLSQNKKLPPDYTPHTNTIEFSPSSSPLVGTQLSQKTAGYKLMTILHHMQNADEKLTKPTSMGYVMLANGVASPSELFVPSVRPFPTYHNMNVAPAGVSNLLTSLVTSGKSPYSSVAVAVESHQNDMKLYLEYLNKIGLPVKRYADIPKGAVANGFAVTQIPPAYMQQVNQLYPRIKPNIYQIDLSPVKQWIAKGIPAASQELITKLNPEAKPFMTKKLDEEALITILQPPAPAGARKSIPRE